MNVFEQLGCTEDSEYEGVYSHYELPFELVEEDGFISLYVNLEYEVSRKKIPYTKQALENLIDAFNPKQ